MSCGVKAAARCENSSRHSFFALKLQLDSFWFSVCGVQQVRVNEVGTTQFSKYCHRKFTRSCVLRRSVENMRTTPFAFWDFLPFFVAFAVLAGARPKGEEAYMLACLLACLHPRMSFVCIALTSLVVYAIAGSHSSTARRTRSPVVAEHTRC